MSFAAPDLVSTIGDLSSNFSLELYATRDKDSDLQKVNPFQSCANNHALNAGRPDWEAILTDAIEQAHATNSEEGESVGVFFCGSPAIARTLQMTARRVKAEHQYSTRNTCRCRLLVHKENF